MGNKGVISTFLCTNPSCTYSERKLVIESALNSTSTSGNHSFKTPTCCPKCKSGIELLHFVSGAMSLESDIKVE